MILYCFYIHLLDKLSTLVKNGNMLINARTQFQILFTNPVFLSCIFSWLSAQFIKTVVSLISGKIHSIQELFELLFWRTGGMPSSHTSLVVSLVTTIGFRSGVNSDIFILAFCFMMVVIRDALGVRRSSGIQAKKINEIGRSLAEKDKENYVPIKEVQGHKPMEVLVGGLLGLSIGIAFSVL